MASKPGIFTDWPWKSLGSFKYVILAPWVTQSLYSYMISEEKERDLINLCIFPFLLVRILHNQLWISFSRHRTGKGKERIVDKGIEFDQVDRESNWDDQILMQAMIYYIFNTTTPMASRLPFWRTDGVILTILLHTGPVEFLYYWLHRALHHHYLYSRYHSHHHSSIATEPITSVIHPFAETMVYFLLFAIPQLGIVFTGTASLVALFGYIFYIDFMNNMGHCNFEWIPKWLFSVFPPLKYLMYTPSFHSLHHTQFRTNYSLFMPFYDYIYNTVDKSSGEVQETALRKPNDSPQVVHLTHLTTPESIYHLRLASATMASKPQDYSAFFLSLMRPLTYWFMVATWFCGHTFIVERNVFNNIVLQTWVIPKYKTQYTIKRQREVINNCIEEAIMQAEERGAKVLSLGLLNQGEELNRYGELYIQNHPKLKIKVVDGSSLATALVLNSIPKGTNQVLLRGKLTKVAHAIALALSHKHIKVAVLHEDEYEKLRFQQENRSNVVLNASYEQKIWLIGDELTEEEQLKAPKGTLFIPFMQFPPKKVRKDCFYSNTPAMLTPKSLENLHSCEDWLPRRVLSSWRVAGIVHALEEWNVHECGDTMLSIDKVWKASLRHGFRPLSVST